MPWTAIRWRASAPLTLPLVREALEKELKTTWLLATGEPPRAACETASTTHSPESRLGCIRWTLMSALHCSSCARCAAARRLSRKRGLRLPERGEPGLDPTLRARLARAGIRPLRLRLPTWREAVGFAPAPRMHWSYAFGERGSLGMWSRQQPRLRLRPAPALGLRPLLVLARLGAQRRDRCRATRPACCACRTSASACSAASRHLGSKLHSRRHAPGPVRPRQHAARRRQRLRVGPVPGRPRRARRAKPTRRRTAPTTSSTSPARSTSTSSSASRCGRSPRTRPRSSTRWHAEFMARASCR